MRKIMILIGMMLFMVSCGKQDNENKQNVSNMETPNVDEQEIFKEDSYNIWVDEEAVIKALNEFSMGLFMQDYHKHDDGSSCIISFRYEPNYASVEFDNNPNSGDNQYFRLEMQNGCIRVLLYDSEGQSILLESEGMIDNVNPDNLMKLGETLMNYESVENVGTIDINGKTYWVENVKYKDNEIVQLLVCMDQSAHSMVKYGDLYLTVTSYKSDREVVLDGSDASTLDEINSTIKTNIPEERLNEWTQWLNN